MPANYYYWAGSMDKKTWDQLTPLLPELYYFQPDIPFEHLYPYLKVVKQTGRIRRVQHIQSDTYWQIKHGHVCPTCKQFVFGSIEPKE